MFFTMIFKDLLPFIIVVVLMELPFIAAISYLESGYGGNENFATFASSALSFFKVAIDSGAPEITSVTGSSVVLFSIGIVLLVVLLLNLLIAMFSKTIDDVHGNSTQEYLLEMTKVTFEWTRASKLPSPLTFAMAFKEYVMDMVAKCIFKDTGTILRCKKFVVYHAGWRCDLKDANSVPVESDLSPTPIFDRKHFELITNNGSPWSQDDYRTWCKKVLEDWSQTWKQQTCA